MNFNVQRISNLVFSVKMYLEHDGLYSSCRFPFICLNYKEHSKMSRPGVHFLKLPKSIWVQETFFKPVSH